jgi:hypothetical protein
MHNSCLAEGGEPWVLPAPLYGQLSIFSRRKGCPSLSTGKKEEIILYHCNTFYIIPISFRN